MRKYMPSQTQQPSLHPPSLSHLGRLRRRLERALLHVAHRCRLRRPTRLAQVPLDAANLVHLDMQGDMAMGLATRVPN